MKKYIIIISLILSVSNIYAFGGMFLFARGNRSLPQYIEPDYIRDDYKRFLPDLNTGEAISFFDRFPLEFHLSSVFSYGAHNNTFNLREFYFTLGQTYYNNYISFTPFATAFAYFDTHNPDIDYDYVKGNVGLYDGGFQAVIVDRVLLSARGRAVFDINTTTFMLMPHYYDAKNPAAFDSPEYYLTHVLNGAGIRVGFIGNYFELAYSQGDYRHSIPKAALLRVNLPYTELRLLYQHENRKDPEIYTDDIFESLAQISAVSKIPVLNSMWVNLLGEYTFKEGVAHYVRIEEGFEWNILNIALREMIYIKDNKAKFYLEYALYAKPRVANASFSLGFQGSTDGRYYIMGNIKL